MSAEETTGEGGSLLQDRTKGRLLLPVRSQEWWVVSWPEGTLSHFAWEAVSSPVPPPAVPAPEASGSGLRWLSLC